MSRFFVILIVCFSFISAASASEPKTATKNDSLTQNEINEVMKSADNSFLMACLEFYQADIFVQELINNGESDGQFTIRNDDEKPTATLQQLRDYIHEGHLKVRSEVDPKKIPKGLGSKCDTMAQLSIEVMAIKTRAMAEAMENAIAELLQKMHEEQKHRGDTTL